MTDTDDRGEPGGLPSEGAAAYRIGAGVQCSDGPAGRVAWVVVDPVAGKLTHLVVEPEHRFGLGRLVPVELVADPGPPLHLACGREGFDSLPEAEETQFIPATQEWGYSAGQVFAWPYFGLGGAGPVGVMAAAGQPIVYDKVPPGEVAIRRGDPVRATDGDIGSVQGVVVDPADGYVTHVLLQEGHLWGRKQVALPVRAVRSGGDGGIEVSLTREQIRDLPPVDLAGS
ncbi:MAG: PRC-barrel domain-containing protein [Acidimicrobiales bacterium]